MLPTGAVYPDPAFTLTLSILITLLVFFVERSLHHGSHRPGRR